MMAQSCIKSHNALLGQPTFAKLPYHSTRISGRSSLIHFACIGVAPPQLFKSQAQGEATQTQAKWIKLDLNQG